MAPSAIHHTVYFDDTEKPLASIIVTQAALFNKHNP